MCSEKILFRPSENSLTVIERRVRLRKMTFNQIANTTHVLTLVANRLERSIADVVNEMRTKDLFKKMFSMRESNPNLSEVQVANRVIKMLQQ